MKNSFAHISEVYRHLLRGGMVDFRRGQATVYRSPSGLIRTRGDYRLFDPDKYSVGDFRPL